MSSPLQAPTIEESLDITMDKSLMSMVPYGGMPFTGTRSKTKVKPFSFDERDKAKRMQKQEKIQKVRLGTQALVTQKLVQAGPG